MDSFQLRRILLNIITDTKCPNCGSKINVSKINIVAHEKNTCLIKISCDSCNKSFGGHAKMVTRVTDDGRKLNTSTLIEKSPPFPQKVTPDDVTAVHNFLEIHSSEFSEELQKPSQFLFFSEQ